jgi:hypothetical protein
MGAIANPSAGRGRQGGGLRVSLAIVVSICVLSAACGQFPTGPSTAATRPLVFASADTEAAVSAKDDGQRWEDFQARGWSCRTPNNGPVTVCSPPNQPLPAIAIPPAQPPADRPPTVNLKRWRNGEFEANVLLMRPEIYNGQRCESTGQPFSYIVVLGYYECAHTIGS